MKNLGYYNGKIGLIEEMTIPMGDRAAYFGDGVYDATMCRNGRIFLMEEHIQRFLNNCARVQIEFPYNAQQLAEILEDAVSRVDAQVCFLYWQASRGTAPRKHAFPDGAKANLYLTVTPSAVQTKGETIRLITYEDLRYLYCDIKTICLLPSVLASQAAEAAGCGEVVLHRGERVTECAHSNVSILKDGVFRTAPLDHYILPGIARAHLIQACGRLGIPVEERAFTLEELRQADEILVSSSSKFCMAASELDGQPVGGKDPDRLQALEDAVFSEFYQATDR